METVGHPPSAKSLLDEIEPIVMTAVFDKPSQRLLVIVGGKSLARDMKTHTPLNLVGGQVDQIAGCTRTAEYKPEPLQDDAFPVLIDTRPTDQEHEDQPKEKDEHHENNVPETSLDDEQETPIQLPPPRAILVLPKRLPNGNWACSHTCNAKGKTCKHGCCRDGVKHKPKVPKIDIQLLPLAGDSLAVPPSAKTKDAAPLQMEETCSRNLTKSAPRKYALPELTLHVDGPDSDDWDALPPLVPGLVAKRSTTESMDGCSDEGGFVRFREYSERLTPMDMRRS